MDFEVCIKSLKSLANSLGYDIVPLGSIYPKLYFEKNGKRKSNFRYSDFDKIFAHFNKKERCVNFSQILITTKENKKYVFHCTQHYRIYNSPIKGIHSDIEVINIKLKANDKKTNTERTL